MADSRLPRGGERITGLVLAGGRGLRMGGVDKGLQVLGDTPLAQNALMRLTPQTDGVLLSANRSLDVYRQFGVPVLSDAADDFSGPLAGILAGLRNAPGGWVCVVPCDVPFFPMDLVARFRTALTVTHAEIAFAATRGPGKHHAHPVLALLRTDLADDLETFLRDGGRQVAAWYARHKAVEVSFDDERAFYNVNTLNDLAHADRR